MTTQAPQSLWASIEYGTVGSYISGSDWAFPTIETLHVISIITVLGAIMIMDLRLLGLMSRNQSVGDVSRDTIPLTWIAFSSAVITGVLLFVSKATSYMINPWFLWKISLIVLAGINMSVFNFFINKTVGGWDAAGIEPPTAAKISAGLSLSFWLAVLFCGRMIGFTLGVYHN